MATPSDPEATAKALLDSTRDLSSAHLASHILDNAVALVAGDPEAVADFEAISRFQAKTLGALCASVALMLDRARSQGVDVDDLLAGLTG